MNYADFGWETFPCNGKFPATPNGFEDADTTGEVFKKYPGENVALATGVKSGVFVLDVDVKPKKNGSPSVGAETLAGLVAKYGPLPVTVEARTWSGGSHYFFKMPEGGALGCRIGFLPDLDIRANGGYALIAPSTIQGKPYTWVRSPADCDCCPAPSWLLAILDKPKAPITPADATGLIVEGNRNGELTRRAGKMRAAGVAADEIYTTLARLNATRCSPPLSDKDVRVISNSVARYDPSVDNLFLATPHDQEGHYQVFMALHGKNVLYTREMGWLVYHNGFWDKDLSDKYLSEWITDTLRRRKQAIMLGGLKFTLSKFEASRANIDSVKAICRDRLLSRLSDFNAEPHLLNCNNGVLNLKTLELVPHSPDFLFNYKLATNWNPEVDSLAWVDFVGSCVGEDPADFSETITALELLQIAAGYSLTGDTTAETMFYVFGPPRSGKGTFMTALQSLMGPLSNTVNIGTLCSASKCDNQNFELAGLSLCRYVTVAETGRDTYLDSGRIKNLTGNDPIQCAFKFKDSFRYTPIFKIWVSSNHEVNVDAGDDAVWDRMRAFHFLNSHKDCPDTSLKRRMIAGSEAVLLWCAQGAQAWFRLQEQGKPMPRTDKMREYLKDRKDEADYVMQFLDDDGIAKPDYNSSGFDGYNLNNYEAVARIYGRFKDFCGINHIDKFLSLRSFVSDLKRRGFIYTQRKIADKTARVFLITKKMPTGVKNDLF
jgi:P4 family phage/plasmid primase-like protien